MALDGHAVAGIVAPPPSVRLGSSGHVYAVRLAGVDVDGGGVPVLRSMGHAGNESQGGKGKGLDHPPEGWRPTTITS